MIARRRLTLVAGTATALVLAGGAAFALDPSSAATPRPAPSVSVSGDTVTLTTDLATARHWCAQVTRQETRLTKAEAKPGLTDARKARLAKQKLKLDKLQAICAQLPASTTSPSSAATSSPTA